MNNHFRKQLEELEKKAKQTAQQNQEKETVFHSENKLFPDFLPVGAFKGAATQQGLPLLFPFAQSKGICFEINQNEKLIHEQMQLLALYLIENVPNDLLNLTFADLDIDSHFEYLLKLNSQVCNRIFIRQQEGLQEFLDKMGKHAQNINDHYLMADYKSLHEYNHKNNYQEPYHVLFISNFPNGFEEDACQKTWNLVNKASKAGIYVVMSFDKKYIPKSIYKTDLDYHLFSKTMGSISFKEGKYLFANTNIPNLDTISKNLHFEFEKIQSNIHDRIAKINNKFVVENPSHNQNVVSVYVGQQGSKPFFFELGSKTGAFHALVCGGTGSGKTTLINNIICQIGQNYSSDDIRLCLMDYKKGVEFDVFRNHPNVETLLLDNSKIEDGISILENAQNEVKRRAYLGINDLALYNKKNPTQKLPYLFIIIDEFQQLFTSSYKSVEDINMLLKEIAKQGRGFGIHLILITQTMSGEVSFGMDTDTLQQFALRIALKSQSYRHLLEYEPKIEKNLLAIYDTEFGKNENSALVRIIFNLSKDKDEAEKYIETLNENAKKQFNAKPFEKRIIEKIQAQETELKDKEATQATDSFSARLAYLKSQDIDDLSDEEYNELNLLQAQADQQFFDEQNS